MTSNIEPTDTVFDLTTEAKNTLIKILKNHLKFTNSLLKKVPLHKTEIVFLIKLLENDLVRNEK